MASRPGMNHRQEEVPPGLERTRGGQGAEDHMVAVPHTHSHPGTLSPTSSPGPQQGHCNAGLLCAWGWW